MSEQTDIQTRLRRHRLTIDGGDWVLDGVTYAVSITIDEAQLDDIVARAMSRHDHRTELGGGAFLIEAVPQPQQHGGAK